MVPPAGIWKQLDSLNLNYTHFGGYRSPTVPAQILDSATAHNMTVQLVWERAIPGNPYYPQYTNRQAERMKAVAML